MARNQQRFARNKREQARQERAAKRRARKRARSSNKTTGQPGDPDYEEVETGPEAKKPKASDAEVQAAIERAMNPGKQYRREKKRNRSSRLFVGNLDYGAEENELRTLFSEAGYKVAEATVVKDRETGRSRGFAFVELGDADEAERAIEQFDGAEFSGRELRVNPAD